MSRGRTSPIPALLVGLFVIVGLCCSAVVAGAQTTTTTGTTTTGKSGSSTKIPAGTTLRIGDQLKALQTVLGLAGEDKNFPYTVEYSAFVGGPPMLQAFQAGSIDAGFVGSTPLIFAQAAKQDITAAAGWAVGKGSYGLVVPPGTKDINGWKDLKGKKVIYQQGTAAEAAILQALDTAGLKLSDITPVNLPLTQASAALQGGSADAAVLVEPLTSVYLQSAPGGKVVAQANEVTDRSNFLIATKDALNDKGKSAALGDYISRLVRAYAYTKAHPDQIAQAVYVDQYHLPADRALEIVKAGGGTTFVTLPGDVVKAQQRLANLFFSAGEIPVKVDVKQQFSTKYNAVVQAAQNQQAAK